MDTPMYLTDTECDSTLAMELDLDHHESDHDYMQVSNDESLDDFGFFGALSNDREEDWALFDDTLTWDGRGWNFDGLHQSPLEDIVLPPCSPIDASYRPQAVSEPLPAPGQFPESMLLFSKPLDTSELQRVSGNSLRDPSFMEMSPPIQLPPGSRSIIAASAMPTGHQHQLLPLLGSRVFHPPASSTMPLQHAYAPLRRSTAAPAARSTSKPLQPRKQPLQQHINGWPGNESWTPPPGSRRLATAGLRLEPAVLSSLVPAKSAARRKPVKAM